MKDNRTEPNSSSPVPTLINPLSSGGGGKSNLKLKKTNKLNTLDLNVRPVVDLHLVYFGGTVTKITLIG